MALNGPQPRRRVLEDGDEFETVLTWYPPGLSMAPHAHDCDQDSLLLAGSLQEETASRKIEVRAGAACFKAAGLGHANVYGREGALIMSLNRPHRPASGAPWRWRPTERRAAQELAAMAISTRPEAADALSDFAELMDAGDRPAAPERSPHWLERVRAALDAEPGAARTETLAAEAGVHRVHLCRRFAAAYGVPFSLYRRQVMVARALRDLLQGGETASVAALNAGFADQAHFARALKAETGATPRRLSALLSAG